MKLPDKVYHILKWSAAVVLPAIGTCYFALAEIWGFPYASEVVGTIAAVNTFAGALIGLSNTSYKKENK